MKKPNLAPVNLKNPQLDSRSTYLVYVDGQWRMGYFEEVWPDEEAVKDRWSFGDGESFYQLNGEDGSDFKAIYKIA